MDHLFFTIYFSYDLKPTTTQIDLSAEIEMADNTHCIVRGIRRVDCDESPLLPEMSLEKLYGVWVDDSTKKASYIGTAIGEAINSHLRELSQGHNKIKNK